MKDNELDMGYGVRAEIFVNQKYGQLVVLQTKSGHRIMVNHDAIVRLAAELEKRKLK